MKNRLIVKNIFFAAVAFFLFLLLWILSKILFNVPSYILPSFSDIITTFQNNGSELYSNYKITFWESFLGMFFGTILGVFCGLLMAQSTYFRRISMPVLIASNAIPVIAIAPLIIIWFGSTLMAKVVIAGFISFFPVVLNTYKGLSEYEPYYLDLFSIYGASKLQFLFFYKMRNALPYIFTGIKLNSTLSVIGAIVAEFVSSNKGLGFGILQASYNFNTPKLWCYIILSCTIGVFFNFSINRLELLFNKHKNQ